ncbi:hypothetical protein LIA77_02480 [Sarocladium implicatum]|nr:hypothetical protein LIA77_02480 [Sarocladium implicatum]
MTSNNRSPSSQGSSSAPDLDAQDLDNTQTLQDGHSHNHAHSYARLHHTHNRFHSSDKLHGRDVEPAVPESVPQDIPAAPPPNDAVPYSTQIVQTVELVTATDAAGLESIQTVTKIQATILVDPRSGVTVAAIPAQDAEPTPPAPAPEPAASEAAPSDDVPATRSAPLTSSISTEHSDATTSSTSADPTAPTTAPLPPTASTNNLHHHSNATSSHLVVDSSTRSAANSTIMKVFDFSTTSDPYTTTSYAHTISHTTLSSFMSSSSATQSVFTTSDAIDGGAVPTAGEEDQAGPTAGADDSNNDPLSPREKQIVGGVVGSVAGAAFLLLLVMLALRYKKRRQAHTELDGDDGAVPRAITAGPVGGGSGPGATEMSQRSSMPAAVAAAFANLTGKRRLEPETAPDGERGFYRVSGRKLQPVLQTGGDGYTDPHDSMASGYSDYYRGSQAFERGDGPSNHLALGTPMRPASGVMIMRDGPGRTPITEQNPFADPDPPSPPPSRGPGTLGRSLASHDGSGASGSRFREGI